MHPIFLVSLLCAGLITPVVTHYYPFYQAYNAFVQGQKSFPLPTSKASKTLQQFYLFNYNERYSFKIVAPFLTNFLQEQSHIHNPTDVQLLNSLANLWPQNAKERDEKAQAVAHYCSIATQQNVLNRGIVKQQLDAILLSNKALTAEMRRCYQEQDLRGLLRCARENGRSEIFDVTLYFLASSLSVDPQGDNSIAEQQQAIQKIYGDHESGNTIQQTINNALAVIKDYDLRMLCYMRRAMNQLLKISKPLRLEYLLRSPQNCVYTPQTYEPLLQTVREMRDFDKDKKYADYTNRISDMIAIYNINYVVNIFKALYHRDKQYAQNKLIELLHKDALIKIVVIDHRDPEGSFLLDRQNIDLFFKQGI